MKILQTLLLCLSASAVCLAQPIFKKFDVNPGTASSDPWEMIQLNGSLLFMATTNATGTELWRCDGTTLGTYNIKDIYPGKKSGLFQSSESGFFTVTGTKAFFIADDSTHGEELWVTDGTTTGTNLVKDLTPGINSTSFNHYAVAYNGEAYFNISVGTKGSLWKTDGTAAGTIKIADVDWAGHSKVYNGKLYFSGIDNNNAQGQELWVTDGTTAGTKLIKDIWPGKATGFSGNFLELNSKLYFIGDDSVHGKEIWMTDGTTAGTIMLKDINPGTADGTLSLTSAILNGKLYFMGNDGAHGKEIWMTDGTTAGTNILKDIVPGAGGSWPGLITVCNNKLIFSTHKSSSKRDELWQSDGTAANTTILKDLYKDSLATVISVACATYKNKLYFTASNPKLNSPYHNLWQTDGSATKTIAITPTSTNRANFNSMYNAVEYDGWLYFRGSFDNNGTELWALKDTSTETNISNINNIVFNIFPNPSDGMFTLQLENINFQHGSITVYDVTGKLVYMQKEIPKTPIHKVKIDTPKGIYLLKLQLDDAIQTKQIVIE